MGLYNFMFHSLNKFQSNEKKKHWKQKLNDRRNLDFKPYIQYLVLIDVDEKYGSVLAESA